MTPARCCPQKKVYLNGFCEKHFKRIQWMRSASCPVAGCREARGCPRHTEVKTHVAPPKV